ncbi:MAG: molybdopterin molybdotransferase MoeA [Gammaproteobacteria bacterium]|nr:molybdopterin molybdotransferase MoeA [Gammaproteobacteria bacterium]
MTDMLSIDDAVTRLASSIQPIKDTETVSTAQASLRVLANDVIAPISLPPFTSSAMDGYAIKTSAHGGIGSSFRVVGTSFAGSPYQADGPTDQVAVRIFTGAVVPDWADAVVLQEDVARQAATITLKETPSPGDNIRLIGHDVKKGELLLGEGTKLGAFEVSWLAACGVASVTVVRQVRVAIFSTGDELQDPGQPLSEGQIYDSNRTALTELLKEKPVEIADLGRLPDDPVAIEEAIAETSDKVDLIVTSGGVSVGDADYLRPVIQKLGELTFWNVALKPGKPIAVGRIENALFLGLPGNPVSTIITYLLFVARAVDALSGVSALEPLTMPAILTNTLRHSRGRREYQRGILSRSGDVLCVRSTGDQSSNRLATLAGANCLIVVPESADSIEKGAVVDVLLLAREAHHVVNNSS